MPPSGVDRGFVLLWRKAEQSDFWQHGAITVQIFFWLLMRAAGKDGFEMDGYTLKRGQVVASVRRIREALKYRRGRGFSRHSPSTIHSAIHAMKALKMIEIGTLKAEHKAEHQRMLITICKYDDYNESKIKRIPKAEHGKKKYKNKTTKNLSYQPTAEAHRCLVAWRRHRATPKGVADEIYLKIFDDLHRLDKVSWEDIHTLCKHAVTEWTAGMIQSPSKLRKPSRTYPELKTWQVLLQQAQAPADEQAGPSIDDTLAKLRRQAAQG